MYSRHKILTSVKNLETHEKSLLLIFCVIEGHVCFFLVVVVVIYDSNKTMERKCYKSDWIETHVNNLDKQVPRRWSWSGAFGFCCKTTPELPRRSRSHWFCCQRGAFPPHPNIENSCDSFFAFLIPYPLFPLSNPSHKETKSLSLRVTENFF